MPSINMLSSAEKVKGQGVLSAYKEQVSLVQKGLEGYYDVMVNHPGFHDIMHYHTIDLKHYLSVPFARIKGTTVAFVHFVPSTIEESLNLPYLAKKVFYRYIIAFYKSMDHLVVVNPYFIDVLESYGIDKNKVIYIPNYVSEELFHKLSPQRAAALKDNYGIDREKFTVLGVGQVQHRKGILDFIDVALRMPDIQFIWAGGFSFGAITDGYKELKAVIENPPENIKFLGIIEREKMNHIYNMADMLFLPSYSELFPMTVLESMCLGLPLLLRNLDIYESILFDCYLKGSSTVEFSKIIRRLQKQKDFHEAWSRKSLEGHKYYSKDHVLSLWHQFYDRIYYLRTQEPRKILH